MTNDRSTFQLVAGLSQVAQVLRSNQWSLAEKHALTPTQISVLTTLGSRGAMRVSALARHLLVTQPTISDAVSALEAKELVKRRPDPADGRAKVVETTNKAKGLLPDLTADDMVDRAIGHLEEADCAALKRGLSLIIRNLQDSGGIAPQRDCLSCRFFRPYRHRDAARPHHCEFVDAAFGDASLRQDCAEHEDAPHGQARDALVRFTDRGGD